MPRPCGRDHGEADPEFPIKFPNLGSSLLFCIFEAHLTPLVFDGLKNKNFLKILL